MSARQRAIEKNLSRSNSPHVSVTTVTPPPFIQIQGQHKAFVMYILRVRSYLYSTRYHMIQEHTYVRRMTYSDLPRMRTQYANAYEVQRFEVKLGIWDSGPWTTIEYQ